MLRQISISFLSLWILVSCTVAPTYSKFVATQEERSQFCGSQLESWGPKLMPALNLNDEEKIIEICSNQAFVMESEGLRLEVVVKKRKLDSLNEYYRVDFCTASPEKPTSAIKCAKGEYEKGAHFMTERSWFVVLGDLKVDDALAVYGTVVSDKFMAQLKKYNVNYLNIRSLSGEGKYIRIHSGFSGNTTNFSVEVKRNSWGVGDVSLVNGPEVTNWD